MKKFSLFLLLASFSIISYAQKTIHDANAEIRTVGSFHGIEVGTGIELIITQDNTEAVAVSAASNIYRDRIVCSVEGGILKIHYDNKLKSINTRKEKKELRAYVSYKMIDVLNANTGAEVKIEGELKATSLKMEVHTGAIVEGKIKVDDLDVDQGTGSEVRFSGEAGKLTVDGDTGSMFRGIDLVTKECYVNATTGSGVYITVEKELSVKANTGAHVKYKGDASLKDVQANSGGSVSKVKS